MCTRCDGGVGIHAGLPSEPLQVRATPELAGAPRGRTRGSEAWGGGAGPGSLPLQTSQAPLRACGPIRLPPPDPAFSVAASQGTQQSLDEDQPQEQEGRQRVSRKTASTGRPTAHSPPPACPHAARGTMAGPSDLRPWGLVLF